MTAIDSRNVLGLSFPMANLLHVAGQRFVVSQTFGADATERQQSGNADQAVIFSKSCRCSISAATVARVGSRFQQNQPL